MVTDTSGRTDSDTVLITVLEQTTQKTDVSRITQPIVPDGSLSEWAGADTVTFAGSDNTATVSLTWDENNLYLGFDITDTNLQASGTDEGDSLHRDDSIEIYLDTVHDGGAAMQVDDYHFIINLNHALVDDQGTGSGKNYSWTSHINYAIDLDGTLNDDSDTDNGYVIEVAIPWSDIGGAPVTMDVIGLNLCVNNNDSTETQSVDWCNLASWAVPDGWGDATFMDDNTAPTVVSHSPTGTDVPVDSVITVTFSEEMDHPSTEDAFSTYPAIDGAFAWAGNTMTITPSSSLEYKRTYIATVGTGARSASAIHLKSAYTWQFTAEEMPDNSPTARAGSDQTVNMNTPVTFDGSASTDDYGIESYVWDFDNRNDIQIDATGITVLYTYTEPGAYNATLTVTDTSGQTDSDNVSITVLEQTTQKTDVSGITNPIIPDGSLSEWTGADTVTFAGSDNTATVSLTWDTNNLYFGFDITDTNLRAVGIDEGDSLHRDDSIEIYLDTSHDGGAAMQVDDYHFIINLNGALVDDQGTGSGKNYSWTSHINYAINIDGTLNDDSDTDNGYVIEVAIPWSDIGGAPVTGDIIGLDLAVNDRDGTEVQSFDWCNLASWAVPDGWGDATFMDDNRAPILDPIGNKSISEGYLLKFTIYASDPDGDSPIYSADNLPSGATFDPAARTFSWTPDHGQAGSYPVHFEVTDGYLTDTENITITVSNATTVHIRLEAEDADEINPSMEIASDPSAYNNSYIWVPDGGGWKGPGYARYILTITTPGDYKICGRVQAPTSENNSFLVRMDDDPDRTWTIPETAKWGWDAVNHWGSGNETDPEIDPAIFTLSAGEHVLTIKHRECGTKLDRLLITNDLAFVPHVQDTTLPVVDAGPNQIVNEDTVVYFDGSGSTDNIGIRSFSWDFDASDGIRIDATGVTVSHTYTEPGSYIVTLTVTDTFGNTDNDTCMVTVDAPYKQMASHFGVNDTSEISGTYVQVPVNIVDVTTGPIQTIKFDVLYNESILNLNSNDPKTLQPGTLTDAGWWFMLGSNNHSITLTTAWQSLAIPDGSTGSVVMLNFSVIGAPGTTSYMDISEIEFANTESELGTAPIGNGTFSVLRLGTISGTIAYSCNRTAIAGAVVNLAKNGSLISSTTTDVNGMYTFTDIEPGEYDVSVSNIHFWDNSTSVTVYIDQETVSDHVLLLRGDLNDNGEIADAADVNMMMQAFTRDIPGDRYFDLNENDKIADFGDVEMILLASIGELIL
jgi:PKD repeat protein